MTSWACFLGPGLKFIFHWKAHLSISATSFFSSFSDVFISCVTENRDMSSANSLAWKKGPVARSLTKIKHSKRPKMDSWGTPEATSAQLESCPFNTILCFLSLKKLAKHFCRFPLIWFCFNLKITLLCQTLSNARNTSRNTSWPHIFHQMICKYQELLKVIGWYKSLKLNWFVAISLFFIKNWSILSKISFSRILAQMGSSDIGQQFFRHCLLPFFMNLDNVSLFPIQGKEISPCKWFLMVYKLCFQTFWASRH